VKVRFRELSGVGRLMLGNEQACNVICRGECIQRRMGNRRIICEAIVVCRALCAHRARVPRREEFVDSLAPCLDVTSTRSPRMQEAQPGSPRARRLTLLEATGLRGLRYLGFIMHKAGWVEGRLQAGACRKQYPHMQNIP